MSMRFPQASVPYPVFASEVYCPSGAVAYLGINLALFLSRIFFGYLLNFFIYFPTILEVNHFVNKIKHYDKVPPGQL